MFDSGVRPRQLVWGPVSIVPQGPNLPFIGPASLAEWAVIQMTNIKPLIKINNYTSYWLYQTNHQGISVLQ